MSDTTEVLKTVAAPRHFTCWTQGCVKSRQFLDYRRNVIASCPWKQAINTDAICVAIFIKFRTNHLLPMEAN